MPQPCTHIQTLFHQSFCTESTALCVQLLICIMLFLQASVCPHTVERIAYVALSIVFLAHCSFQCGKEGLAYAKLVSKKLGIPMHIHCEHPPPMVSPPAQSPFSPEYTSILHEFRLALSHLLLSLQGVHSIHMYRRRVLSHLLIATRRTPNPYMPASGRKPLPADRMLFHGALPSGMKPHLLTAWS